MAITVLKTTKTSLGNEIQLLTPYCNNSENNVLIIGVFHGDEPQGKFLIEKYLGITPPSKSKISVPPSRGDMTAEQKSKELGGLPARGDMTADPKDIDTTARMDIALSTEIKGLGGQVGCGQNASPLMPNIHPKDLNFKVRYKQIVQLAKNLRNNSTEPEVILWQYLKNKNFGVKFRRQVPIGKYIADFASFEIKLIIELDGGQHNTPDKYEYDVKRDIYLQELGFTILRFWNTDIYKNLESILERIYQVIENSKQGKDFSFVDGTNSQESGTQHCPLLRGEAEDLEPSTQQCPPLRGEAEDLEPSTQQCPPLMGEAEDLEPSAQQCPPLMGGPESLIPRGVKKPYKRLLFIPCLNPDGMLKNTRTNANGVDLNRNFPTKNWGEDGSAAGKNASAYFGGHSPASEIETKFVIDVIEEYKPKVIITLHAPYKVVNYDGPAKNIAEQISEIIKYPVEASIGYPTPGSFGTYCGVERNIPTITLELDEKIPVEKLIKPVFEIFDIL